MDDSFYLEATRDAGEMELSEFPPRKTSKKHSGQLQLQRDQQLARQQQQMAAKEAEKKKIKRRQSQKQFQQAITCPVCEKTFNQPKVRGSSNVRFVEV